MGTSTQSQSPAPGTSRRSFLTATAAAGAWVCLSGPSLEALAQQAQRDAASIRWLFLTDEEARFLIAATDRLIPADDYPSASEAGVVHYIDYQLATDWGRGAGLYLGGPFAEGVESQGYQLPYTPAELYRSAIASIDEGLGGEGFAGLSGTEQDEVLTAMSKQDEMLGDIPASTFFDQLRANAIEGYFADPAHNGNFGAVGWEMIGFPGAHAYYLTEVDRYNMVYRRQPVGKAYEPGRGEPRPIQLIKSSAETGE